MELMEFKREDYIYLMVNNDLDNNGVKYNEGEILRYRKNWLIEKIASRYFFYGGVFIDGIIYCDSLECDKNDYCNEDDILYDKIYKSLIVSEDKKFYLHLCPDDYIYFNDWLFKHLDTSSIKKINDINRLSIESKENENSRLTKVGTHIDIVISFKEGEVIDFTNPAVITLFYDLDWIKLFANTEVIVGDEKEKLFREDFSNAIYAQNAFDAYLHQDDSTYNLHELHYFMINEDIKTKKIEELGSLHDVSCIFDDEGLIKYIVTQAGEFDTSSRTTEQTILNYCRRMTKQEARDVHEKLISNYIENKKIEDKELREKFAEDERNLKKQYEQKKNDPFYFPGVNGYFVHNTEQDKDTVKEKYTLLQVKNFYQNLKTLNPDIVKEMCFYGGTVPYILNNETISRNFGDIDIFVPVSYMGKLREELFKQDSFEIIYDSKPLAKFCHLTSRIKKESTELLTEEQLNNEFLELVFSAMDTNHDDSIIDIDKNGNLYDPFEEYNKKTRSYYNTIQDFGFKAKLFGINISVFPIYQYGNDIMAKSFNVNDMHKFLLGVKILNDTQIGDFVKNVQIYDSAMKIFPLEYTLVSKKSAVEGNYSFRLEKDSKDIEYILEHKEQLKIDDNLVGDILRKYPDYSISIAYKVNDNGTTTTMNGASYKRFILANKRIVS